MIREEDPKKNRPLVRAASCIDAMAALRRIYFLVLAGLLDEYARITWQDDEGWLDVQARR